MLIYSLDFLYSNLTDISKNEIREIEEKLKIINEKIKSYYDSKEGLYKSSIRESHFEETRFALFSINIIEDIIQDSIHYFDANFQPITQIYQTIEDPIKIVNRLIKGSAL